MSRLIDADALIADCQLAQKQADRHGREFANAFYSGGGEISTEWWCVEDMIENAPTIEERKTGRWEDVHIDVANDDKGRSYRFYSCTACGVTSIPAMLGMKKEWLHFCPNCGADMRGEQDETTD